MDDVKKDDKIHKACCSWHRSQEILYKEKENQRCETYFNAKEYADLIQEHCSRITAVEPLNDEELSSIVSVEDAELAT